MRPIYLSLLVILVMSTVSFSITNVSSCQAITNPGVYELVADLSGAPIDASPVAGTSCIKIASNDVVLDCVNLFNIENNGTGGTTIGIQINGTSTQPFHNVTVRNCPSVAYYTYGIYATYLDDSNFTNVWAINNTADGFHLKNSSNISFSGCYGNNNGASGFTTAGSGNYTLTAVTANSNSGDGFKFDGSSIIIGSELYANSNGGAGIRGIALDLPKKIYLEHSTLQGNADGAALTEYRTIEVVDTITSDGSDDGIRISDSGTNGSVRLTRVEAIDNDNYGIHLDGSTNVRIDDSIIHGSLRGIHSYFSDTDVRYSTLYNNVDDMMIEAGTISLTQVEFRDASGSIDDPSTISASDTLGNVDRYTYTWSDLTRITPPRDYHYLRGGLNITVLAGTPTISSITWHWSNQDLQGINEGGLLLKKYDGAEWYDVSGANLNANANTLTISDINQFSIFSLFHVGPASYWAEFYGANVTNVTTSRWGGTNASGNDQTEGGNITGVDINGTTLTDRWAAFYGNITGDVFLGVHPYSYVYKWSWDSSQEGVLCLSTDSTLPNIFYGASGSDVDSAWGFGSVADSGSNTFNYTDCVLGGTQINGSTYADTGPAGGFTTCALKTLNATATVKNELAFCGNITSGTAFNGQSVDFELMVPTDDGAAATETYYFFADLS